MLVAMCVLLTIAVAVLLFFLWLKCDELKSYEELLANESRRANRYQDHFWRLVNSPVVDKTKWEIRLPWQEVGVEESIRLKNNNKA
jgi:Tfp pilus assembly protein PilO